MSEIRDIDVKYSQINTAQDQKDDALMVVSPYASWEHLISPAPFTINLLGQLMLLTAENDFSLSKSPPKGGFKVVNYPESLRACLMQVSNCGWTAFNEAHTNMDKIRLEMSNVTKHIQTTVKILLKGTNKEIALMLPQHIDSVKKISESCCKMVLSVEAKFSLVMELTKEILEASTNARGKYEQQLKETKLAIEIAELKKREAINEKTEAEEYLNLVKKDVACAQKDFEKAMNSIPSGVEILAMTSLASGAEVIGTTMMLGAIGSKTGIAMQLASKLDMASVMTLAKEIKENQDRGCDASKLDMASVMTLAKEIKENQDRGCDKDQPDSQEKNVAEEFARMKVMQHAEKMYQYVNQISTIAQAKDGKPDSDAIKNGLLKSCQANLHVIHDLIIVLPENYEKLEMINICKKGLEICKDIEEWAKELNQDDELLKKIQSDAGTVKRNAQQLVAKADVLMSSAPIQSMPPRMAKIQMEKKETTPSVHSSVVQSVIENARFKAELAERKLKYAQDQYEQAFEKSKLARKKNEEFIIALSSRKMEEIDFESIRKILIRGINELAKLREEWGKLVRFFQMMSNTIHIAMNSSFTQYIQTSQNAVSLKSEPNYTLSEMFLDMIYSHGLEANKIAYIIQNICSAYVDVSDKYIMDQIAGLGRLLALDPNTDKHTIMLEKTKLQQTWKDSEEHISMLMTERKHDFNQQILSRIQKIETEIKAYLPLPEEKVESMIQSIEEGISAARFQGDKEEQDLKQWA